MYLNSYKSNNYYVKFVLSLIYSKLPVNKQMLCFSATYPSYMGPYVTRYMRSPTYVRLNIVDPSLRGMYVQTFYFSWLSLICLLLIKV